MCIAFISCLSSHHIVVSVCGVFWFCFSECATSMTTTTTTMMMLVFGWMGFNARYYDIDNEWCCCRPYIPHNAYSYGWKAHTGSCGKIKLPMQTYKTLLSGISLIYKIHIHSIAATSFLMVYTNNKEMRICVIPNNGLWIEWRWEIDLEAHGISMELLRILLLFSGYHRRHSGRQTKTNLSVSFSLVLYRVSFELCLCIYVSD